jgi:hypothetical protein
MARVIVTSPCVLPASGGQPAVSVGKGAVLEVTAAMAAAITTAGGTTRAVSAMSGTAGRDQLGEAAGVSNGD